MSTILFFRSSTDAPPIDTTGGEQRVEEWIPRFNSVRPDGLPVFPYAIWWLFHALHIFSNRSYRIFLVRDGAGRVLHRSGLFPRYFRFPFMAVPDLQIGDVWTAESARGQGLAATTLRHVLTRFPRTAVWFLCQASNEASINLAMSAGLEFQGSGKEQIRRGFKLLKQFVVCSREPWPLPRRRQDAGKP